GYTGDPSQESFLRPGYGVVTDPYGPRTNPVTGAAGFHTGVDLGDPYGANVSASKSGEVVYSGWIDGYGNTVIIDHGSGFQTLYGHNSSLLVSVGQKVSRGETISLVGSTGMSTGPHIHWEIRINGQHVNPLNYL
ncbi:M23 family metallopeptidase, partial [Clostridium sp.]|uniref:M23 family metallopeptidase n=1 Tax=Clostridium sp. TaxID=1506 RepID=UPI0026165DDE